MLAVQTEWELAWFMLIARFVMMQRLLSVVDFYGNYKPAEKGLSISDAVRTGGKRELYTEKTMASGPADGEAAIAPVSQTREQSGVTVLLLSVFCWESVL